jgi:zinc transport system permease protein
MLEFLGLPVFSRALLALLVSGAAYPAMGTYILSLEMVPARFAVMHASLLGAAVAILLGIDPSLMALGAALAVGLGVARMGDRAEGRRGGRDDSSGGALALMMSLCLGLAFIVFHKGGIRAIEAFNLFWGNILALRAQDLWLTTATALLVISFTLLFFKEIRALLYDRALACSSGMRARGVYYGLMLVICLGLGMAMRLTGALLADALTIMPALAARSLRRGFKATLIWGACLGIFMNLGGFALALAFDLPTGPAIIVLGAAVIGIAGIAATLRRRAGRG